MKQYTTPEQTAKLIELGFEEPKSIRYPKNEEEAERVDSIDFLISDYSIGELIEMLPETYDSEGLSIGRHYMADVWIVRYPTKILIHKEELIDALYDMIVKLKEEG